MVRIAQSLTSFYWSLIGINYLILTDQMRKIEITLLRHTISYIVFDSLCALIVKKDNKPLEFIILLRFCYFFMFCLYVLYCPIVFLLPLKYIFLRVVLLYIYICVSMSELRDVLPEKNVDPTKLYLTHKKEYLLWSYRYNGAFILLYCY